MQKFVSMFLIILWTATAAMNSFGDYPSIAIRSFTVVLDFLLIRYNYITLADGKKVPPEMAIPNLFSMLSTICAGLFLVLFSTSAVYGVINVSFAAITVFMIICMLCLTRKTHKSEDVS